MYTLIIAEKGLLGAAIATGLGGFQKEKGIWINAATKTTIVAAAGHLFEMDEPDTYLTHQEKTPKGTLRWRMQDLPIIPNPWRNHIQKSDPQKSMYLSRKDVLQRIVAELKIHEYVIHAGDPDREGQGIVDDILAYARYQHKVDRIWIQDTSPNGIKNAFAQLKPNSHYWPLSQAQKARSQADWLVGMNMTRFLTLKAFQLVRVGRVKTPICALLVQRERDIASFVKKDYYIPMVQIAMTGAEPFWARWIPPVDYIDLDDQGRLTSLTAAKKIIERAIGDSFSVTAYQSEKHSQESPLPFSLSRLQKHASRWNMSVQNTLDTAQVLYLDLQAQSYPRTDCSYLPESLKSQADSIIKELSKVFPKDWFVPVDTQRTHKAWNDSKITAHYGIIPTGHIVNMDQWSVEQRSVFGAVVKQYLALFYPPYRYESQHITLSGAGHQWEASATHTLDLGWKTLLHPDSKVEQKGGEKKGSKGEKNTEKELMGESVGDDKNNEIDEGLMVDVRLPVCRVGDAGLCQSIKTNALRTSPPSRFTDVRLVEAMVNIQQYVSDPHMKSILKETSGLGTEATRAALIEDLVKSQLLERDKKKQLIPTDICTQLVHALESIKNPLVDIGMTAHWEDQLKSIEQGQTTLAQFMDYVTQSVTQWVKDSSIIWPKTVNSDSTSRLTSSASSTKIINCPKCDTSMRRITGKNGPFWTCNRYPDCTVTLNDNTVESLMTASSTAKKTTEKQNTSSNMPSANADVSALCSLTNTSGVLCNMPMQQKTTKNGKMYMHCPHCRRSAWANISKAGTTSLSYWPVL